MARRSRQQGVSVAVNVDPDLDGLTFGSQGLLERVDLSATCRSQTGDADGDRRECIVVDVQQTILLVLKRPRKALCGFIRPTGRQPAPPQTPCHRPEAGRRKKEEEVRPASTGAAARQDHASARTNVGLPEQRRAGARRGGRRRQDRGQRRGGPIATGGAARESPLRNVAHSDNLPTTVSSVVSCRKELLHSTNPNTASVVLWGSAQPVQGYGQEVWSIITSAYNICVAPDRLSAFRHLHLPTIRSASQRRGRSDGSSCSASWKGVGASAAGS